MFNFLFHISQWPHLLVKFNGKRCVDRSSTGTNQKALTCQADQSPKRAACQRDFSLATFLRHCKARLMVVVILVLLRQGLLLLSTSPLLLLFKLLFQVLCQVFWTLVNFCEYIYFFLLTGALGCVFTKLTTSAVTLMRQQGSTPPTTVLGFNVFFSFQDKDTISLNCILV